VIDIGTHTKHRDRDFKYLIRFLKITSYRHRVEFVTVTVFLVGFNIYTLK